MTTFGDLSNDELRAIIREDVSDGAVATARAVLAQRDVPETIDSDILDRDVVLDLLAILDEACNGRLVGSESTTLELVVPSERDSLTLTLSDGTRVELRVRVVRS
jgi:hypothetical protein